ncbi:NADH dehydrogenase (ubiquinone) 30 kDa subunit [Kribbella flavida DSM 17836]|uniref:NADH dehydrogenase (Ubiquinone) 30 kDa subunit n=1 Tax=Kribbella flavida (strain DSM 17836 / JCM 10339 / NBRC 14399) TaxID=479435 RepID=D2PVK9_KRIFD|nr:NADH-quinone oxidoreductase subunit C [Kribbella flavida]ADB35249.1 NADH dehydrogenase (ubiquinone) 30 kDa subunit [Kribbella flavida DSM 17836]
MTDQPAADHLLTALTDAGIAATRTDSFGPPTLDVPVEAWVVAHELLRDEVGMTFFDFLSASDELTDGFRVVTHLADFWGGAHVEHVLVRTLVPRANPELPTLSEVYAGANWHERETHEMFGIGFDGHPNLLPLLLPDEFEGHPLRKEFVLASRVAKPWPGAKEPGESDHAPAAKAGAPSRRRTLPPGVPDPETWGPRPPGSPDPDPLAPAQAASTPARPRRAPGDRRARKQTAPAPEAGDSAASGTPSPGPSPGDEPGDRQT